MSAGPVLITGQLRSGTSCVAEIVHNLGVPVAFSILAPVPPTYRPDWEDADLALALVPLMLGRQMRDPLAFLKANFAGRVQHARRFWNSDRFATKSPVLALIWDDVLRACHPYGKPIVLMTSRDQDDIDTSVRRSFLPSLVDAAFTTNRRIRAALETIEYDHFCPYESTVEEPEAAVFYIAGALGISDPERIAAAVACIKEPTSVR